jgi:ABC-type nitrate/sulfonate/bicarbonate transport system ATPase subunit
MSTCIQTRHLSVQRGGRAVLSDIDLTIHQGECIAIVGRSGTGKSTLLHALAGHLPFSGEMTMPRNIGMVFQQFAVFPWFTAAQNIGFGLPMKGSEKAAHVRDCLRLAGLENMADSYPSELSGGQQQRIAIARAIAHKPDVLLMDEPFGSLDAITRRDMQEWLRTIRGRTAVTTLLVTHDIDEALSIADRVLIMRDGRIVREISGATASRKEEIWKLL